jgi:hypothetical protein
MKTIDLVAQDIVQNDDAERLDAAVVDIFVGALLDGARYDGITIQQRLDAISGAASAALNTDPALPLVMESLTREARERITSALADAGPDKEKLTQAVAVIVREVFQV